MYSARTRWALRRNALSVLLEEVRLRGVQILDLTETNPTRVGLEAPEDLLHGLGDPAAAAYTPVPAGLPRAREAVSSDFGRRGFPVPSSHIVLTSSSSEAYAFLFKLLCDPGDSVLVPSPSYPLFEYLAKLESVRVQPYALRYDGTWHVDLSSLDPLPERARAIVVVNPNNPTGTFLKQDELENLVHLAARNGLALLSDEVFADYALAPAETRIGSLATEGRCLSFSLGGLSKSCGLPQLKLGWIAVSGPERERNEALERLEVIADTYLSVGAPVQVALPGILSRLAELQRPIQERISGNLGVLRRELGPDLPLSLLHLEGGWSAVLRVPATETEETWTLRLLGDDSVLVHPGYFFDFPGEAYLVLSLLPRPSDFREGVMRLIARVSGSPKKSVL
jgi:aspartate/methionine/tyrosine aminotransferase